MDFRGWVPPEIVFGLLLICLLAGGWVAFVLYILTHHLTIGWH